MQWPNDLFYQFTTIECVVKGLSLISCEQWFYFDLLNDSLERIIPIGMNIRSPSNLRCKSKREVWLTNKDKMTLKENYGFIFNQ